MNTDGEIKGFLGDQLVVIGAPLIAARDDIVIKVAQAFQPVPQYETSAKHE